MFVPCATVRRVMPGQISIVGFSRFISEILRGKIKLSEYSLGGCDIYRVCWISVERWSGNCGGSCVSGEFNFGAAGDTPATTVVTCRFSNLSLATCRPALAKSAP